MQLKALGEWSKGFAATVKRRKMAEYALARRFLVPIGVYPWRFFEPWMPGADGVLSLHGTRSPWDHIWDLLEVVDSTSCFLMGQEERLGQEQWLTVAGLGISCALCVIPHL